MTAILMFASACGSDQESSSPKPTETATTTAPKLIDYEKDGGVILHKASDISKLDGAPDDFKQFIAGVIDTSVNSGEQDTQCPTTISVDKFDPSGYAAGSIGDCGGAELLWAKRDGAWQQIWGGQTIRECADMKKYSVPVAIAGDQCWDGKKAVTYTG